MQLAHWYFHFYPVPARVRSNGARNSTLFPIRRVFAGISLSVPFIENSTRAIVMCIWCAAECNCEGMQSEKNSRLETEKREKCNNKFDSFNTFWNPQTTLIVVTTKIPSHFSGET